MDMPSFLKLRLISNTFQAADYQPFQIKLRRNAKKQFHIQRVVMRDERTRRGAAGDGVSWAFRPPDNRARPDISRMDWMMRDRVMKTLRLVSLVIRSRYRWRYFCSDQLGHEIFPAVGAAIW